MIRTPRGIRSGRAWARLVTAGVVACGMACGTTPFKGDTGIRPFAFDLWDVHCPSGMRVLFERAPGSQTAGVTFVVGAGGAQDPPGHEGLAHLVEHLVFRARDAKEIRVRSRLWAMGATYNAATDFDATTFDAFVPAQSLPALMRLEGEWLVDPLRRLDEATFLVERDIVRNELRERNETHAFGAAFQAAFQVAFPASHPYRRPLGGSHESLSALTLEDAAAFAARYYRPENITMVVAGDMDLAGVEAFVRATLPPALYGDPAHPHPIVAPPVLASTAPEPPADTSLRRARAAVTTPELWIAWTLPGGEGPENLAWMWNALTGQNFWRGRLPDNDVAGVSLFAAPGVLGSILICRIELTEGSHPEQSLRDVVAALPWIGGDEVRLDARFRWLKLAHLRQIAFSADGAVNRTKVRARHLYLTGNPSAFGQMIEQVKSITADEGRAFAKQYLGAARARAVLVEPLGEDALPPKPIPAAQDLATIVQHEPLSQETLRNLAGVRHLDGLRVSKLDNGLEVVVLPRRGAPVATAKLAFHGDRAAAGSGIADAAHEGVSFRLEESPSDYGMAYWTNVGTDLTSTTVLAGTNNVPRGLDMMQFGTRSLEMDWPSDKFLETRVPLLRRREASPQGRAARAYWKALFGAHPLAAQPLVDEVIAHKSSEIEDWLASVVTPANGVLVVVGDVDAAEIETAARSSLSRLSSGGPSLAAPAAVSPPRTSAGVHVLDAAAGAIITHRPGATQAELELGCLLPPVDARGAAVNALVVALVQSRLEDSLREREGTTYGVHAWTTTLRGGTSVFNVTALIDNGRLPLALDTVRRFWSDFARDGIPADAIRRARDALTTYHLLRYDTSSALANRLVELWNQGWPLEALDDLPAALAATTDSSVKAALEACADNLVVALTGDEATIRAAFASPAR